MADSEQARTHEKQCDCLKLQMNMLEALNTLNLTINAPDRVPDWSSSKALRDLDLYSAAYSSTRCNIPGGGSGEESWYDVRGKLIELHSKKDILNNISDVQDIIDEITDVISKTKMDYCTSEWVEQKYKEDLSD